MYKTKSFYLSLFFIALLISGCGTSDENKVEYQKTYHRNGKLFEVTPYVKGKVHGKKLEYYADGALRKEVPYDSGKVHGTVKFYYPDGKLFSETPQVNGKIHGLVKKYHKNGKLHSQTPYLNGKVQPGLMEYNQRGEIKELPKLVFSLTKTKISKDQFITLEMRLSSGQESVKYFQSVDENDNGNVFAPIPTENGVGQLRVVLTPGSDIDTQVLVRAEFVTAFRNRCVLEETYRIKARN